MTNISVLFKIAGIGIITAIINMLLKKSDKDEIATLVTIVGLIIVLLNVVEMISELFESMRSLFNL